MVLCAGGVCRFGAVGPGVEGVAISCAKMSFLKKYLYSQDVVVMRFNKNVVFVNTGQTGLTNLARTA